MTYYRSNIEVVAIHKNSNDLQGKYNSTLWKRKGGLF